MQQLEHFFFGQQQSWEQMKRCMSFLEIEFHSVITSQKKMKQSTCPETDEKYKISKPCWNIQIQCSWLHV